MGNPFRRIKSPASTALQVIEAHRLFHLVTVIVHGKAMHCRSNCRAMLFYSYCAIISQLYVILCLLSYGAHFGLLCLLCHNKPTVCHTRDGNSAAYAAVRCCRCTAPRSVVTKICITSQHQRSAAYYNFLHFFAIIASELFCY